jgi:hypothetical protein
MRAVLIELAAACPGGSVSLDACPILEHFEHASSPITLKPCDCCS